MKVKHLTSNINNTTEHRFKGKPKSQLHGYNTEHMSTRKNLRENKIELNTRPAQSVNFGGSANSRVASAISGALKELASENPKRFGFIKLKNGEVGQISKSVSNFIDSPFMKKALRTVKENEAKFENIITIFLAGLLKPICVLAMPGAEKEDKQAAATKNFVAAVTGFAMSCVLLTPISKGVSKVTANLPKYIKDPEYIKLIDSNLDGDMADAFSTFYKKAADLVITPAKAAITIGFMPYLLNYLFKKDKQNPQEIQAEHLKNLGEHFRLKENEQIFNKFAKGEIK